MNRLRSGQIVIDTPPGAAPRVRRYPRRGAIEWDRDGLVRPARRHSPSPIGAFATSLIAFAGIGIALQLGLLLLGSGSLDDLAELALGVWTVIWSPVGFALGIIGLLTLFDRPANKRR